MLYAGKAQMDNTEHRRGRGKQVVS